MIKFILLALLSVMVLFIYSACIISSRCSREEEKSNKYANENKN